MGNCFLISMCFMFIQFTTSNSFKLGIANDQTNSCGGKLHEVDCERRKTMEMPFKSYLQQDLTITKSKDGASKGHQSPTQKLYGQGGVGGVLLP